MPQLGDMQQNLSYNEYLKGVYFQKKENSLEEITDFLSLIEKFEGAMAFPELSYFVIDYSAKRYLLLKGSIQKMTGYHPLDYFNGGIEFNTSACHKSDFEIYNKCVFKNSMKILENTLQTEHEKYTFSHNFRMTNKNGSIYSILQKGRYITSPKTGLPLYCFGTWMDITLFKKDSCMVQVIDKYENQGRSQCENIFTGYFYPDPEETLLTRREKEILFWLAEGFSTKQLADKLHLAENTITNHRTNILRKTNTKNVAQLIAYAVKNKII